MAVIEHPVTASDARQSLMKTLKRFREQGLEARPVIFGAHRKAEAVVVPYETYRMLLEIAEEASVARTVTERSNQDDGSRFTLGEAAQKLGIDLEEL